MKVDIGRKNLLEIKITADDCWECINIKPKSDGRYYQIMTGSRKDGSRKPMLLHRYMYQYFIGRIPEDMVVRHKCDNNLCVNTSHLEIGTHKDNMNDMKVRGRSASGIKSATAKLSSCQINEIRDMYSKGIYTQQEIADIYLVSQRQISNIVNYKNRLCS